MMMEIERIYYYTFVYLFRARKKPSERRNCISERKMLPSLLPASYGY
jgi:hypothetical protein